MTDAPDYDAGLLNDPNAVHVSMLRGSIAKPSWQQIKHIYAADVEAELATLRAAYVPTEAQLLAVRDAARIAAFDEALQACLNYRKHGGGSVGEKAGAMECALAISDMKQAAIRALAPKDDE